MALSWNVWSVIVKRDSVTIDVTPRHMFEPNLAYYCSVGPIVNEMR